MMLRAGTVLLMIGGVCAGCSSPQPAVVDAFPPTAWAAPWILQGEVWSGSFDEAAPALGDDAGQWRALGAAQVWLARYCHEQRPEYCLTVRCFAFASPAASRGAYDAVAPDEPQPFGSGDVDAGCWTEIGVLFQWGRLVFDVFGPVPTFGTEMQAAVLANYIVKRMPAGLPDDPR